MASHFMAKVQGSNSVLPGSAKSNSTYLQYYMSIPTWKFNEMENLHHILSSSVSLNSLLYLKSPFLDMLLE
jgi:hypothetical protein